jgi:hypothetical protein
MISKTDLVNTDTQKVLECLHCGNKTLMNKNGEYRNDWDEDGHYYGYFIYKMFSCPICSKVTLLEVYWDVSLEDRNGTKFLDEEIIYPVSKVKVQTVPKAVQDAFEAALKVSKIESTMCLIGLRRTMEAICNHQKAEGKDLFNMIENLVKKGILPPVLKEASSITRILGNSAAHGEDIAVSKHDVPVVIELIQYIIDYLYVLPEKIKRQKMRIDSLKTKEKQPK